MESHKDYSIKQIAAEAGVSPATISRFLNKSGYVEGETARRIELVISKYAYAPNRRAQSLRKNKSMQIVVMVPDICNPFYSNLVKTMQSAGKVEGYSTILANTNEDVREELYFIKEAKEIRIDGIVICTIYQNDTILSALEKSGIPTVVVCSRYDCPFDLVHGDRDEGTYLTTRHLLELNHSLIGFAGGPNDSQVEMDRIGGYMKAMDEAELVPEKKLIFEMDFSEDAGFKAGKYFTTQKPMPTAICCANDLIALGVFAALDEDGIKVPEDISVSGVDNINLTNLVRPRLTTVFLDGSEFGRNAFQLLFDRIKSEYNGQPRKVKISASLLVRESARRI